MRFFTSKQHNRKKILSSTIVLVMLTVMLFSTVYLFENADHICTGTDCSVCATMKQCSDNLRTNGTAVSVCQVKCPELQGEYETHFVKESDIPCHSLVSWKVRLDH